MAHEINYQPDSTKTDMYRVYVDDMPEFQKWIDGDTSIALSSFVGRFEVYHSMQGAQGQFNPASKGQLASDLGSDDKDECLKIVLRKGAEQMGDRIAKGATKGKYSSLNDADNAANVVSQGAMAGGRGGR